MHKLILAAAISAGLAGCATHGGGGYTGDGAGYSNPYYSGTGSPNDWSQPYYDRRYWPPVVPGQAFPPQIMDGGSQD
jgi:hypothetical protein